MQRRTLLRGLVLAALDGPFVAAAQPASGPARIGLLSELTPSSAERSFSSPGHSFRKEMRKAGYVEGRDVVYEIRWAAEQFDQLPRLAAELVQARVDLIVTGSTPTAVAASQATKTIPILTTSADPVGAGLVTSLARPGRNVTGVFIPIAELGTKRLQLLREVVPGLDSVAFLLNPANPTTEIQRSASEAAARALGIATYAVELRSEKDVAAAFATIRNRRARAILVVQDPVTLRAAAAIADAALRHRLPASHAYGQFVRAGGLMSYGVSLDHVWEMTAVYADKILKGARPADLPMEQPRKFELLVNLKTARALGLTIPASLLLQADEAIE